MDPIVLNLRTTREPPASDPVGGELAAEEVDANVLNLRTACEQLDTEKVSEASLVPVTEVASAQSTDLLLMERAGAPVKAPVSTLPQPAPVATAVRDALASLSGTDRLPATAIRDLPASGGGISDAPSDGMDYARRDAAWQVLPKFISLVKLADESRSNNTYAADDTLQAPLEANSVYRLELMLRFRGGTAEDFRFRINRTGLSDAELRFAGDLDNNSAPTLTWSSALNCAVAAAGTNYIGNYLGMVITGADPGTLIVEWAQQVTGATAATLAAGSMLMLRQVYREPPDTVPAAMTIGQWSLTPIAGGFRIGVTELPADGGQPISDIQRLIEGGSWTSLGGATLGDYDVTGLSQVELDVQLRTVNSVGPSLPSDTKTDTPLAAGGGGALTFEEVGTPAVLSIYAGDAPRNRLVLPPASVGDNIAIVSHAYAGSPLGAPITDSAGNVYTSVAPAGWTSGFILLSQNIQAVPAHIDIPWTADYIAPTQAFVIGGTVASVTTFEDTQGFETGQHVHDYTTPAAGCVVLGTFNFDGGGGNVTTSTFDAPTSWVDPDPAAPESPMFFYRAVAAAGAQTLTMTPNTGIASATRGIILSPAA